MTNENDRQLQNFRARLEEFRKNNPVASIGLVSQPGADGTVVGVLNPWGDDTVALTLAGAADEVISALNSVILPERYSAIWHRETERLEIAFTAFPMPDVYRDIPDRAFTFRHDKG